MRRIVIAPRFRDSKNIMIYRDAREEREVSEMTSRFSELKEALMGGNKLFGTSQC